MGVWGRGFGEGAVWMGWIYGGILGVCHAVFWKKNIEGGSK